MSGAEAGLPPIEVSIDGGAETWAVLDADLAAGRIDEAEWFDRHERVLTAAYLSRDDPRAQSGHSGDEARWEAARRPMLAALAARRLPQWADRLWVGNALDCQPPRRFDYVRTGLEYVPSGRVVDLVGHLLEVAVRRKLIIGVMNEAKDRPWRAQELVDAGYVIAGQREWPKPDDPRVVRRVCWIERGRQ